MNLSNCMLSSIINLELQPDGTNLESKTIKKLHLNMQQTLKSHNKGKKNTLRFSHSGSNGKTLDQKLAFLKSFSLWSIYPTEVTCLLKCHLQRQNSSVCQGKTHCFISSKYSLLECRVQKLHVIGQIFFIPETFIWYLAVSCLFY